MLRHAEHIRCSAVRSAEHWQVSNFCPKYNKFNKSLVIHKVSFDGGPASRPTQVLGFSTDFQGGLPGPAWGACATADPSNAGTVRSTDGTCSSAGRSGPTWYVSNYRPWSPPALRTLDTDTKEAAGARGPKSRRFCQRAFGCTW